MRKKITVRLPPLAAFAVEQRVQKTGKRTAEVALEALEKGLQPERQEDQKPGNHDAVDELIRASFAAIGERLDALTHQLEQVDKLNERRILNAVKIIRGEK